MNNDTIDYLVQGLKNIDDKIKYLENSPNRAFTLVESETLGSFHWLNLCFKHFWKEDFDRKSASKLLLYQIFIKTHSELSSRYSSLLREQVEYLKGIIDNDEKSLKDLAPVFFGEEKNREIIDYYEDQLKYEIDTEGNPLYKVDVNKSTYLENDGEGVKAFDFYTFRSDRINYSHYKGLQVIYSSLKSIFNLMSVICSYPEELTSGYKPNQEEIITALENESSQYARLIGKKVERDLKRTAQELKPSRNASLTPDVWGRVMDEEDDLYRLAISGDLEENKEKRFDNIFMEQRKQLTENYSLLQKIKSTCLDEELFDIRLSVETHNLLSSLNGENLDLFYELVLRRNIIQREMFPEKLKAEYVKWVNSSDEEQSITEVEFDNEKFSNLDIKTPEAKLIMLLSRDWFNEITTDEKLYTLTWRSNYVKALMKEFSTQIAEGWVGAGKRNKQNLIKGHILGALKKAGVITGANTFIARKAFYIGVNTMDNEGDKIAPYMSHPQGNDESNQNPYIDWTLEYVKNNS